MTSENKFVQLALTTSGTKDAPLIHVESLPPMTPDEFAQWLWNATTDPRTEEESRRQRERLLSRCVVPTWKASEASAEEIKAMARRREIWNAVKKEHPLWSRLEIDLEARKRLQKKEEKTARVKAWEDKWEKALAESGSDFADLLAID